MAAAYGIISFLVVFGLKSISGFLHHYETWLQLAAAGLLLLMGYRGLRPATVQEETAPTGVAG